MSVQHIECLGRRCLIFGLVILSLTKTWSVCIWAFFFFFLLFQRSKEKFKPKEDPQNKKICSECRSRGTRVGGMVALGQAPPRTFSPDYATRWNQTAASNVSPYESYFHFTTLPSLISSIYDKEMSLYRKTLLHSVSL